MKKQYLRSYTLAMAAGSLLTLPLTGQDVNDEEEEVFELSPFEVQANDREGYQAVDTLAGNRLNTKLRDVGNAISVVTTQFLEDTGATDNKTLLQYTTGTEVGGTQGTFAGTGDGALLDESSKFINPNQNTRVRGLAEADNARDFFTSDIPWDGYNVERVELQRGPNSILFGQGSPAGLVNVGLKGAAYENEGQVELRFDQNNSIRMALDLNKVLIEDELAVRFSVLNNDEKYKQKPAYSLDKRIYAALRWDPAFLNGEGIRTTFKANLEDGKIESNNPRTLPPIDRITPWFETGTYNGTYISDGNIIGTNGELVPVSKGDTRVYPALNKQTFNAHQLQQDNVQFPNHGQGRPGVNGGPYSGAFNPDYNPRLGSFADAFGGPINYFATVGGAPVIWQQEIQGSRGINSDGDIDGGIGGFDFNRSMGIATESAFARSAGLPFGEFGVYKNNSITDPSIFNFYDTLIDGPNKEEWQDFNSLTASFSQTYMSDMVGFDVSYNKQDYDNGQLSLLTGSQQAIYIDMMEVFPDGNTDGWEPGQIPFSNGTPNPNVGRPFISDKGQFGNNSYASKRESLRVTPFVKYDLSKGDGNWFTNLIGTGTFTGLYSEDSFDTEKRNWQQYAIEDQGYIDFMGFANVQGFNNGDLAPSTVVYLGDSLINASSAVGAYIPGISQKIDLPRNSVTRVFDSTWGNYPGVDPAAEWINNAYLPPELEYPDYNPVDPNNLTEAEMELWPDRRLSTQAENPLNYVGWRDYPYALTASEDSAANRERLTTRAALDSNEVESQALIWQGHLLNDSIVGTYGWRKDTVTSRAFSQDSNNFLGDGFGYLNFDPSFYTLEGARERQLEIQSHSYSIVTHLDQLPVVSDLMDNLPFRVSFFYNNSTNFKPESARVDAYGESISAPAGETWDKGILIQSKNGRYSFKLNKFTTNVTNGSSTALSNIGFLGQSQDWGGNWANQFEYDMSIDNQSHVISHIARNRPPGSPVPPNFSEDLLLDNVDIWNDGQGNDINGNQVDGGRGSLYNYGLAPGETAADAAAREANAIAAWRSWQASIDPRFYEAWQIDLSSPFRTTGATRISSTTPQNLAVTEDSTSQGYEMEFTMRPTENWNIMINAAKTTAVRNNIGGTALNEFIAGYENALNNTAAGDIRVWWGGAGNETTLFQWNQNIGSEWTSRKLQEGTNVPELREWRVNMITNYDFTEGKFAGLSVGGGLRYQDSVIIGYTPVIDSEGKLSYDLENPYMGPSEMNLDLWAGYGMELNDNLDWRIQLNVRNAFEGDGLIPVTTQPDGTPAGYRIAPSETWSIRNTFSF